MVQNQRLSRLVIAVLAGAGMYVLAVLLRGAIYRHLLLPDWFVPIDAIVVYLIAMLAGVVAMFVCAGRNLIASALAAGVGEIAHSLLRHYRSPISPWDFISPSLLGALPAALLGAAGAALWLCAANTSSGSAVE